MGGGAGEATPGIEVRRSRRRRRTVAAYQDGDRVVVLIPARFTAAEEAEWVARMVKRLESRQRRGHRGDAALATRARELSRRYLDGAVTPRSVRWVGNQGSRWGSCTPGDGTIRLSSRLQGMPPWVVDYVLLHELAHLAVPGHGAAFWKLLEAYPRTERARGYLEGVAATAGLDLSDTADDLETGDAPEATGADRPGGTR
jgi:predicted metal-dependent hydrolase